jgi:hypothetical protein
VEILLADDFLRFEYQPPNTALEPTATAPCIFDIDMKFDCRHCISESGSSGRGSALDR